MEKPMNMTGRFELDRERSESLYQHMKSLNCDEIAALASEKLHVTIDIVQTDREIHIWQNSQLGDTKRVLMVEGETQETPDRKATVVVTPTNITIDTQFSKGRITDKRHFEDEGEVLAQMLELTVPGLPAPIRTKRFFRKLGPPDPTVAKMDQ